MYCVYYIVLYKLNEYTETQTMLKPIFVKFFLTKSLRFLLYVKNMARAILFIGRR